MRVFSSRSSVRSRKRSSLRRSKRTRREATRARKAASNTRGTSPDRVKKFLGMFLRGIAAVLLAAVTVCGVIAAYSHTTTSEYFAVEKLEIKGERMLSEADVMRIAGLSVGANIFSVDLKETARLLASHPWVLKAEILRHLPRRVSVKIVERNTACVVMFEAPYIVDDSGEVFKRWAPGDPAANLILTGFAREEFAADPNGVRESIKDAIALGRRYRSSTLERIAPLAEIHHEVDGGISITVGEDPFYVRLGRGPYRVKLKRLETLLGRMKRDGDSPAIVYFDNEIRPDRVTVRLKSSHLDEGETGKTGDGSETGDQKRVSKI